MPSTSFFCVDFSPPLWYHENRIEYPAQVPQLLRIRGKPVKIRRNFHYCEGALPPQPDHSPGGRFWKYVQGKAGWSHKHDRNTQGGVRRLVLPVSLSQNGEDRLFLWKGVAEWPITKDRSNALPCCARRRKPWDGCPKRVTFRRRSWVRSKIS